MVPITTVSEGVLVERLQEGDVLKFDGLPALQTQSRVVERTNRRAVLLTDAGTAGLFYSQFDDFVPGDSEELYKAENVRDKIRPGQRGYDEGAQRLVDADIASELTEESVLGGWV